MTTPGFGPATVRFSARHCGPPGSANGGHACGVTASPLGPGPAEVTLLAPPPLDRDLTLEVVPEGTRLSDGATSVATARPVAAAFELPEPVGFAAAEAAAGAFDLDGYRSTHAYPGCFTCGPDRAPGDGLRLFPGPTAREGVFAWPWVPADSLFVGGAMDPVTMWAALDCPSGLSWSASGVETGAIVLGRMTAEVRRAPEVGERMVVAGWMGPRQDRKLMAGSAVWSDRGEILAASSTVWILLTDEQRAAFGATDAGI